MKGIVYLLLLIVFAFPMLLREGVISRFIGLTPEVLSLIASVVIAIRYAKTRRLIVHFKYLIAGSLFLIIAAFGVILNDINPGAIFAGIREYFKYVPFFIVHAVVVFSQEEVARQLKWVLGLSLLQFPVVVYQRFVQFAGTESGDPMRGTLSTSSSLSVVLICAVAMVIAFFLRRQLSRWAMITITVLLFVPTTLNETKATLVLLPIAAAIPAVIGTGGGRRTWRFMSTTVLAAALVTVYVGVYDELFRTSGRTITEFLSEGGQGGIGEYLYKGAGRAESLDSVWSDVGRIDALVLAWENLSDDIGTLALGRGLGSVYLGRVGQLSGEEAEKYVMLGATISSASNIVWEIGIGGAIVALAGCFLIFQDARMLSGAPGSLGALGSGWAAVTAIFVVGLFYKNFLHFNEIGYLFAYFSGYIAAARLRWETNKRAGIVLNGGFGSGAV